MTAADSLTQAEARRLILAEWRRWPRLSNPPNSNDMFAFYGWLAKERPELLSFRCAGGKWQRVRGWLIEVGV